MNINVKNIVYASALFSLVILSPCHANQTPPRYQALDGKWWLSKAEVERAAFVNGYWECYTTEYKRPDSYSNSWDGYAALITERYQSISADDKQSVLQELHEMRDRPGEWPLHPEGGEPLPVPTGLEWLQMDMTGVGTPTDQRGFVEGYLACHAGLNHSKGGVFSKSADKYVNDIGHWYGYVRKTGDINADREDTTIKQVLFMFADKPGASKPNGN